MNERQINPIPIWEVILCFRKFPVGVSEQTVLKEPGPGGCINKETGMKTSLILPNLTAYEDYKLYADFTNGV